ncbi:unnamed protein product, partial [Didymodactylos carnosus]
LESATTNEPTTFTIPTKGAGPGSLDLSVEEPKAKTICPDNQDGTCVMEYVPVYIFLGSFFLLLTVLAYQFFVSWRSKGGSSRQIANTAQTTNQTRGNYDLD